MISRLQLDLQNSEDTLEKEREVFAEKTEEVTKLLEENKEKCIVLEKELDSRPTEAQVLL